MKYPYSFKYKARPGLRKLKNKTNIPLYPLIPIVLSNGSKKTRPMEGLLDSGSDCIFVPYGIAEYLNLPKIKETTQEGVTGVQKGYESEVDLTIGRAGRETVFIKAKALFSDNPQDLPVLIGRKPVFDEYQVIFEEYKDRVRLIPKEEVDDENFKSTKSNPSKKKHRKTKRK